MEDIFEEVVSSDDIKKFETVYNQQLANGKVTDKAQFEYAWCLVRSKYSADIRKGIILLEDLFEREKEQRRDCLYYLAFGSARIKEYTKALQYCRVFLQVEPGNQQVQGLERLIKKRMEKEGLAGMALAGGVVLAVGAIVGMGVAMAARKS
ncbi:mitochondrial fission 1 protein [Schistocerca americana]|uniref:mitochondrial fission 1 protein n=1 Tax=Schistocerca americana TaxID=7009 RepID=UPI001F4F15E5|nr:mitochondrial fission 1 protein [Schistocerca americana]XP_047107781.1 mitochondrial fission 1 protein [Schistocerca piceifrons]XP_049775680.1 mitochondrial fission 1 protein [Schistocerca cancellata]XP_049798932.1 mitochondrial fission 1 protein [Schistocerca nitens]XP_049854671.1 mitochondrial fission 1 protein [Schistocerca gregaria]XP_049951559.1 mitochondrial fission 1 protein [Schistocerca serialis cubense]